MFFFLKDRVGLGFLLPEAFIMLDPRCLSGISPVLMKG